MDWNYTSYLKTDNKHKVFISYYHKDDSYYRERFESLFGHLFMSEYKESQHLTFEVDMSNVETPLLAI